MRAVAIRSATEADLDRIAEIRTRSWQAAYRGILDDDTLDSLDVGEEAERWRGFWPEFPRNGSTLLVATVSRRIVGYALIREQSRDDTPGEGVGELIAIYLDPDAWGGGAGQALLDSAVSVLQRSGCRGAVLWTFSANDRARRFYERNGWARDGAEDEYAGQPEVRYRIDW